MTSQRIVLYTILVLALSFPFWRCGGPDYAGGSEVVGITVARTGEPVPDASVTALKRTGETYDSVATVRSDRKGLFLFSTLDTGTYKLFAVAVAGDTLVGLKSDIVNNRIAPNGERPARVDAGNVVLLPKGWINGSVVIDKNDMSGVLCYTRDSAFIAVSREDGSFTIPRVAEGTYTVCFFYPGYLPARVDGVVVVSGSGTTVPPVYLQLDSIGVPNAPRGLGASYDTVHGAVTLQWNSVPVSDLRDYIVYRKKVSDAGEPLPVDTVRDTTVCDTIFRDLTDTVAQSLVYQVKAVDNANNQSPFSDAVTVLAIPPSAVRPVIRSVSPDTVVAYGGTVGCRLAFTNAFNDYQVRMAFGADSPWIEIPHSASGIADTSFTTGASSTWGRVAIKISFSNDSIDTFFTVRVRPRNVAIVSGDSTDSTITLQWDRSPDSDFKEYALHRTAATDTVIFRSTNPGDTGYSFRTLSMTAAGYWIAVADTEGTVSAFDSGEVKRLCIVNTRPRFTTDTATLPGSALVGEEYSVMFSADDRNGDTLSFALLSPDSAFMNENTLFWTPTIDELGAQRCTVTVHDNHGGIDTLAWTVNVVAHEIWVQQTDSLNVARMQCSVGELNGMIYLVGGSSRLSDGSKMTLNSVEVYDPSTSQWTTKPPASMAKSRFSPFVCSWSGNLYVIGGFSKTSFSIPAIEEYNPITDTWTTIAQLPFMRAQGAACVVGDKCYVIGGQTYDQANQVKVNVKSIDIFDFSTKTWSKGPDLLNARADHQAVVHNGKIYIAGGSGAKSDSIAFDDNGLEMLKAIEVFDPVQNRCDSIGAIITPRSNFAAALVGDSLFLMGGIKSITISDNYALNNMEVFVISTRQTAPSVALPEYRHSGAGIGMNDRIYYIGGVIGTVDKTTSSVLIYYP